MRDHRGAHIDVPSGMVHPALAPAIGPALGIPALVLPEALPDLARDALLLRHGTAAEAVAAEFDADLRAACGLDDEALELLRDLAPLAVPAVLLPVAAPSR